MGLAHTFVPVSFPPDQSYRALNPFGTVPFLHDGNVSMSITVPDVHRVTGQDVNRAMALADAVARYIAELGERVADEDSAAQEAA